MRVETTELGFERARGNEQSMPMPAERREPGPPVDRPFAAAGRAPSVCSSPLLFVVPAFNEQENLPRLLRDLEARPRLFPPGSRLIIVDDGSEDGTAELIDSYRGPAPGRARAARPEPGSRRRFPRRFRGCARWIVRRGDGRHDRSGHDERPRRSSSDARASRSRRRARARVGPRRRPDDHRQPAPPDPQRGRRVRRAPGPRARRAHRLVVLPRVPRHAASRAGSSKYGDR